MIAKFSHRFLAIGLSVLCACTSQNPVPSDNATTAGQGVKSAGLFSGVPILIAIAANSIKPARKKRTERTNKIEDSLPVEFESIAEIQKELEPGKEIFFVDSSVDTIITCQAGTKIFLPANTFSDEPGRMDVCVQEFYSKTDFMSKKLSTVSNGRILESGGTIKINVYKGQEKVDVAEGEAYSILFPRSAQGEMQTFYGGRDTNGIMNWELDSAKAPTMEVKELIADEHIKVIMVDGRPLLFRRNKWKFRDEERNMIHYFNEEFNGLNSRYIPYDDYMGTYDWEKEKRYDYFIGANVYYDDDGRVEYLDNFNSGFWRGDGSRFYPQIEEFMRRLPPLDMETVRLTKRFDHSRKHHRVHFAIYVDLEKDKYRTSFKSKYDVYEDKVIEEIPRAELDYFILSSTEVGWINCDRFPAKRRDRMKVHVASTTSQETQFFMIFEDMNSSVCGNNNSSTTCTFLGAPKGEQVTLVGISFRGNQPVMAMKELAIGEPSIILNDFQPFSIKELEEAIN